MILTVHVIARAKRERVERLNDGNLKVWVRVVPEHGKANDRVQELIADFLNVKQSHVSIVRGETSRVKTISIITV